MLYILLHEFIEDIRKQKLRTFLMSIAFSWGTFTIIILLSFGRGLIDKSLEGVYGSGDQIISVYGGQTSIPYAGLGTGRYIRLREDDMFVLQNAIPEIRYISPRYGRWGQVVTERTTRTVYFEGVDPKYEFLRSMYPVAGGRFININDIRERRRVVFLGNKIAEELFGNTNPVGKTINLEGTPFIVVGVMQDKIQTISEGGLDENRAVIPYTTFQTIFGHRFLSSILIRPEGVEFQSTVIEEARRVLGAKYKFDANDTQALRVTDYIEFARLAGLVGLGLQIFLFLLGFFTLSIAGVGLANIMYAVVKERTREIGIRKAVGARKRHITSQFVFESILISCIGGSIGILLAISVVFGIRQVDIDSTVWVFLGSPVLSYSTMIIAISVLSFVGFIAGVFPALRAATVDPVESLRYE